VLNEQNYTLGLCYCNGWAGLQPDILKAEGYLTKAVAQGEWDACSIIGQIYEKGPPPNFDIARNFYQIGMDNEIPTCRFLLGRLDYNQSVAPGGDLTKKNEAIKLIILAAQAGLKQAKEWCTNHQKEVLEVEKQGA